MNEKAQETVERQRRLPHRYERTSTCGLSERRRTRRRRYNGTSHRAGRQANRRRGCSDARLQRLDPRADVQDSRRRDRNRPRHERGRPRGNCALARLAAREPLRRDPRHASADSRRGDLHLPGACPRSRRVLVPPSHPRGLRPGDGAVREHPRRPGRPGLLAARQPRAVPDARRRSHRRREDRRLQRLGNDTCRDGPLRQRHARLGRAGPRTNRKARRGRALLLHQHCQHSRVQRDAAGSSYEARRRRQRPLRARDLRRGGPPLAVRAVRGRRPLRASRRVRARAPNARPLVSAGVDHGERRSQPSRRSENSSPSSGRTTTSQPSAQRTARSSRSPLRTRRSPSSPRWTSTRPKAPSTRVRCIRTSSARSRDAVPSAG